MVEHAGQVVARETRVRADTIEAERPLARTQPVAVGEQVFRKRIHVPEPQPLPVDHEGLGLVPEKRGVFKVRPRASLLEAAPFTDHIHEAADPVLRQEHGLCVRPKCPQESLRGGVLRPLEK